MEFCNVCVENKNDLVICEGCKESVCSQCCVEITYHNMIDFPFCKLCESIGEQF